MIHLLILGFMFVALWAALSLCKEFYVLQERARLAEGKYEALQKLNGDYPRLAPVPEHCDTCGVRVEGPDYCDSCCVKKFGIDELESLNTRIAVLEAALKDALNKAFSDRKKNTVHVETYNGVEAGLRKAQSELEELRKHTVSPHAYAATVQALQAKSKELDDIRLIGFGSTIVKHPSLNAVFGQGALCNKCNARGPGQVWLLEHTRDVHLGEA